MTVILDAMGSDTYPDPEVLASIRFAREFKEEIILVGNEEILKKKISEQNASDLPIRIVHAAEVLEMEDKPVENARKKAQNSMAVGMELLKSGDGQAFVSAGNTGGAMVNALLKLGRIKGVLRPALCAIFPNATGKCVVLDIGANAECKPEFLREFAIMGSVYASKVLKLANPRVGLLSNGEEAGKGNQLVKDTYPLLQQSKLNFIGNVEGKEVFGGQVDVVVTDGFTGNVLLKTSEAVGKLILTKLKTGLMSSFTTKLGAALAKPAFSEVRKLMDPSETGAILLLGIDGLVYVGHGRSDDKAMYSAILAARQAIQDGLLDGLRSAIQDQISTL
jgi:glycerol-3-phosphate acyltransferase PlsX